MAARAHPTPTYDGLIAFYPCQDVAATRDFYTRDLGLELVREQKNRVIFRVAAAGYLGFCQVEVAPADVPQHDTFIITLISDDVEDMYKRCLELSIETEGPPRHNPVYNIYHFFTQDPDGHRVEVQRFLEPLPIPN
jgi:catechol 2,3-dioxygenase-like lactoylglutathione lyase family enzyme